MNLFYYVSPGELLRAILLGLIVMGFVYTGVQRAAGRDRIAKRMLVLASAGVGLFATSWGLDNPGWLYRVSGDIVGQAVLIVLAALAAALLFWKIRALLT